MHNNIWASVEQTLVSNFKERVGFFLSSKTAVRQQNLTHAITAVEAVLRDMQIHAEMIISVSEEESKNLESELMSPIVDGICIITPPALFRQIAMLISDDTFREVNTIKDIMDVLKDSIKLLKPVEQPGIWSKIKAMFARLWNSIKAFFGFEIGQGSEQKAKPEGASSIYPARSASDSADVAPDPYAKPEGSSSIYPARSASGSAYVAPDRYAGMYSLPVYSSSTGINR